jgi:hypothetical protein
MSQQNQPTRSAAMKKQNRLSKRFSWNLTVTWTLVVSVILSACGAGAPQTPPTPTVQPTSTATLTPAPTVTPSPTLTATATATPDPSQIALSLGLPLGDVRNPVTYRVEGDSLVYEKSGVVAAIKENREWKLMWTKLLEGRNEYKMPDVPLVMGGVSPAANWEIDSRMDARAVNEDIAAAMIKHVLLPENKPILDLMNKIYPDTQGLAEKVGPYRTTNFRLERTEFMTKLLKLTKGRIYLEMWPSGQVELVNFNKPVMIQCEQREDVPSMPDKARSVGTNKGSAYGVFTMLDGSLVIYAENILSNWSSVDTFTTRGAMCAHILLGVTESLAQMSNVYDAYGRISEPYTDFRLYFRDMTALKDYYKLGSGDFGVGIIKAVK